MSGAAAQAPEALEIYEEGNSNEARHGPPSGATPRSTRNPRVLAALSADPNVANRSSLRSRDNSPRLKLRHASQDQIGRLSEEWKRAYFEGGGKKPRSAPRAPSTSVKSNVTDKDRPAMPPGPENLDPAMQEDAPLLRKSHDSLALNLASLPDTEGGFRLRKLLNNEAPEPVQTGGFFRKFLDGDSVYFCMRHPEVMQAVYGSDCHDPLHPNFAFWKEHPIKTLLFPASGSVYFIVTSDINFHSSPSVRDMPSKFRWKSKGASEHLNFNSVSAGKFGPFMCYTQYQCTSATNKKSTNPILFQLRVYQLHAEQCPCCTCHHRWCPEDLRGYDGREGTCSCSWVKGDAKFDKEHGRFALVQVLDAENAVMKVTRTPVRSAVKANPVPGSGGSAKGSAKASGPNGRVSTSSSHAFARPPTPQQQCFTPVPDEKRAGSAQKMGSAPRSVGSTARSRPPSGGGSGSRKPASKGRFNNTNEAKIKESFKPKSAPRPHPGLGSTVAVTTGLGEADEGQGAARRAPTLQGKSPKPKRQTDVAQKLDFWPSPAVAPSKQRKSKTPDASRARLQKAVHKSPPLGGAFVKLEQHAGSGVFVSGSFGEAQAHVPHVADGLAEVAEPLAFTRFHDTTDMDMGAPGAPTHGLWRGSAAGLPPLPSGDSAMGGSAMVGVGVLPLGMHTGVWMGGDTPVAAVEESRWKPDLLFSDPMGYDSGPSRSARNSFGGNDDFWKSEGICAEDEGARIFGDRIGSGGAAIGTFGYLGAEHNEGRPPRLSDMNFNELRAPRLSDVSFAGAGAPRLSDASFQYSEARASRVSDAHLPRLSDVHEVDHAQGKDNRLCDISFQEHEEVAGGGLWSFGPSDLKDDAGLDTEVHTGDVELLDPDHEMVVEGLRHPLVDPAEPRKRRRQE